MQETDYNKFKKSLARLEERHNDYLEAQNRMELLLSDKESIQESCIQRFEVYLDTSWKHLRKYMIEEMGLVDIPSSPNPIFKKAASSLITFDAELWIEFNKKRGDTSHDYCGDKADGTFEIIPDFIKEAINLYEIMSGVKWRN